jgi:hypothetical protein
MSRAISLRYVLKHPVAFRERYTPQLERRRYLWRYSFTPVALASQEGDTMLAAGRGSGKSFAFLEPALVQHAINHPGEETLCTSFRQIHTAARMERAIDYFETVPFFRLFLKRVRRSPSFLIETHHDHKLYGISVGDDPEARVAQGVHASLIVYEESHQFPERAYIKIQGAKDPRGANQIMIGVPDGRLDTPFRKAEDKYESFRGRVFHLTSRFDPNFNQKKKTENADAYGGESSDVFKQEVDAEWGRPVFSAWDMDMIYRNMERQLRGRDFAVEYLEISGKDYKDFGLTPKGALGALMGPDLKTRYNLAADIGYTQPTDIGIFMEYQERWWLVQRVRLTNRMEHDDQAAIMSELARRFYCERISLDTTDGQGRSIAEELEKMHDWRDRVIRVHFAETSVSAYTPEGKEIKETHKIIGTQRLRSMFAQRQFGLPPDDRIFEEFNTEKEERSADGVMRIITPDKVHTPDMFRVFACMLFFANPPKPPEEPTSPFVMGEWGGERRWGPAPSIW